MTKEIIIDNKPVKFRATAGLPRLYRMRFGRDMLADMIALEKGLRSSKELSLTDLTIFEDIAYIMARHANPDIPDTPEEWLDKFETFSIYLVLPEIMSLWSDNLATQIEPKKKLGR